MIYEVREVLYKGTPRTIYDIVENGVLVVTVFHKENVDCILEALKKREPRTAEEVLESQKRKLK